MTTRGWFIATVLVCGVLLGGWAPLCHGEQTVRRIVAFGDSLTAGLGVPSQESYPAQLQEKLDSLGYSYAVINAGVSGDTTAGGLRRVPWVLRSNPEVVILELGANDGLRGLSLAQTRENLERIIEQLLAAKVKIILAGMKLPPNYGTDYRQGFEAIYPALAQRYRVPLIPFFLEGVAASAQLNQADGIHPNSQGYRIVVEQVLAALRPLLKREEQLSGKRHEPNQRPPAPSREPGRRSDNS